jgi:hypothetical protein
MSIHVHATYRAGVILPDFPLPLPEDAKLDVTVTLVNGQSKTLLASENEVRATAPKITPEEFRERIGKFAIAAGTSLPDDFSRADI